MSRIARVVIPGIPHHITQRKNKGDANPIYFQKRYIGASPISHEKPGKYPILVKVIDIFGNDTSQAFNAEVW